MRSLLARLGVPVAVLAAVTTGVVTASPATAATSHKLMIKVNPPPYGNPGVIVSVNRKVTGTCIPIMPGVWKDTGISVNEGDRISFDVYTKYASRGKCDGDLFTPVAPAKTVPSGLSTPEFWFEL
jgi:hypothetical protein